MTEHNDHDIFKSSQGLKAFEMCYELIDIEDIEDIGYQNVVDISVSSDDHTFLLDNGLVSHNSAMGGLLPSLGRQGNAYFMLKGKPLNAYSSSHSKFMSNKELSSLYSILKNGLALEPLADGAYYQVLAESECSHYYFNAHDEIEVNNLWVPMLTYCKDTNISIKVIDTIEGLSPFPKIRRQCQAIGGIPKIVFATDQDLDGMHIRGLLCGFFARYLPELKDRIGMLKTPVILFTKDGKITGWKYTLDDNREYNGEVTYVKGLGSWDAKDLKTIVESEGLENMVQMIDFDDLKFIESWLGDDSTPRKDYILSNNFEIAKI